MSQGLVMLCTNGCSCTCTLSLGIVLCMHVLYLCGTPLCTQLDKMLAQRGTEVGVVLNFRISDSAVEDRVLYRLTDPASGRTYNTKLAPPKVPGKDDVFVARGG